MNKLEIHYLKVRGSAAPLIGHLLASGLVLKEIFSSSMGRTPESTYFANEFDAVTVNSRRASKSCDQCFLFLGRGIAHQKHFGE